MKYEELKFSPSRPLSVIIEGATPRPPRWPGDRRVDINGIYDAMPKLRLRDDAAACRAGPRDPDDVGARRHGGGDRGGGAASAARVL